LKGPNSSSASPVHGSGDPGRIPPLQVVFFQNAGTGGRRDQTPDDTMSDLYVHRLSLEGERAPAGSGRNACRLLHADTAYLPGVRCEAGCGVALRRHPGRQSPGARSPRLTSPRNRSRSQRRAARAGLTNVEFGKQTLRSAVDAESFRPRFRLFLSEHLSQPVETWLSQGLPGRRTITVIEGDHGSLLLSESSRPCSDPVSNRLQRKAGGNALVGRQLYPMMIERVQRGPCFSPDGLCRLEPT